MRPLTLAIPGGGIYFYHMAGQISYLREAYPEALLPSSPDRVGLCGASAGALAATLAAYDISFEDATNCAIDLSTEIGLWDRPLGLAFVWGALIEEWLDKLLPPSEVFEAPSDGILSLLVSPATPPSCFGLTPRDRVDSFESREDLLAANMASIHIPFFLDSKFSRPFRGAKYVDGSFQSKPSDHSNGSGDVVTLDYAGDELLSSSAGGAD